MTKWPWRKSLSEKISESQDYMHRGNLEEDPNAALFLLLSEIRDLNGKVVYVLGALSVIVVLLLTLIIGG